MLKARSPIVDAAGSYSRQDSETKKKGHMLVPVTLNRVCGTIV